VVLLSNHELCCFTISPFILVLVCYFGAVLICVKLGGILV
jgi:hypothetical protein